MSTLNAGMAREAAFELLSAHNHDPFHIEHAETVEQTMRYFAREYDPENGSSALCVGGIPMK